jgi:hypothetical protein
MRITQELVKVARAESKWDIGNEVLYRLCETYPSHDNEAEIVAKIWLIGRSYAAAIERGVESKRGQDFYIDQVAPMIRKANIDSWLIELKQHGQLNDESLPTVLEAHLELTELFKSLTKRNKRSLASKYLHFHFRNLFIIYDSRVTKACSEIIGGTWRVGRYRGSADNEYRKVVQKCLKIREVIQEKYGVILKPREIDKLLLEVYRFKN